MNLAELQALLYRLITAPTEIEQASADEPALKERGLEAIIAGDEGLSATQRLGIYANAYFYRLHDVCKEDFRCTFAVLGDTNFHNLITGYLVKYPPTKPSILHASRYLPQYLRSIDSVAGFSLAQFPFLADLAQLEQACVQVFHGREGEALDEASLRRIPPESWPFFRIRLHPAVRIFDVEWRVNELMTAIEEGRRWEIPEQRLTTIVVWRQNGQVHHRSLEEGESAALKTAASGSDFASICAAVARTLRPMPDSVDLASTINRMLAGWIRDGLLIAEDG
ncbi:MAG TPA: putative DNA-binding domain-containing protein [Candidatus Binataceae bacterium]|nr:putative DNA-binding domain-containing protein [Candidatus Binataceae bacterium]